MATNTVAIHPWQSMMTHDWHFSQKEHPLLHRCVSESKWEVDTKVSEQRPQRLTNFGFDILRMETFFGTEVEFVRESIQLDE